MRNAPANFGVLLIAAIVTTAVSPTVSAQLSAQSLTPIGARSSNDRGITILLQTSDHPGPDPHFKRRIVPALLGGVAGAAALGFLSLGEAVEAVLLGGVLGSAAGASARKGRGRCTRAQRFVIGTGGALLGAAVGGGLALVSDRLAVGIVATIPVGSVIFMRRC